MLRCPCVISLILSASSTSAEHIVSFGSPLCSYNCETHADASVLTAEIPRAVLKIHGHEVIYDAVTLAHTLKIARTVQIGGTVGTALDEVAKGHYSDPIASKNVVSFRRCEKPDSRNEQTYSERWTRVFTANDNHVPILVYVAANSNVFRYASGEAPLEQEHHKLLAGGGWA